METFDGYFHRKEKKRKVRFHLGSGINGNAEEGKYVFFNEKTSPLSSRKWN